MIARVRIAPVEQWCAWYKKAATVNAHTMKNAQSLVGSTVEIETNSMRNAQCKKDARMWDVMPGSFRKLHANWNRTGGRFAICEHMLELGD